VSETVDTSAETILEACRAVYGDLTAVRDASWPHGESRVLLFAGADGIRRVAKASRRQTLHERESAAYRTVVPALLSNAPELLYTEPTLHLIVTSFLEGEIVAGTAGQSDPGIFRDAGQLIRRMHDAVPAQESTTYIAELEASFDAWAGRATALIPAEEITALRTMVERAAAVAEVPLVWTHRDNSPRNWMLTPDRGLCLIDFGHTQLSHWTADLERLIENLPVADAGLRDAFLAG
jgi:tRNA A-37 threonylcarbamoyl transferase component Bud32